LGQAGLHRRRARKVVYLTEKHKQERIEWAKRYRKWTEEEWSKVIWSDEVYVYIGDDKGMVWVTWAVDEEFHENCVVPTFKQSPLRVMLWGCIMKGRKGPLVVLEYPGGRGGGMTAKQYQDQVLEPILKPFYEQMTTERGQVLF
jgi:hypothetical protein